MDDPRDLNIYIGIDENDCFEYGEGGTVVFYIPHYRVRVNLNRGISKNTTPTFTCDIGTRYGKAKEINADYFTLPVLDK